MTAEEYAARADQITRECVEQWAQRMAELVAEKCVQDFITQQFAEHPEWLKH